MATFLPFGERPNREGVEYVKRLLEREGLVDEAKVISAGNLRALREKLVGDCCYVVGEHLATYAILDLLRPSSVISVDAHTDLMHDYLDHGSWLAYALENNPNLRAAVFGPVLMIPTTPRTQLWTRRVRIFPALQRTRRTGRGWKAYTSIRPSPVRAISKAKEYLGEEVYLTVDIDVLRPEYGIARFQHGELDLDELLDLLGGILENFRVRAFDIAEISARIKRSKKGKRAVVEVFSLLREGVE